MCGNFSSVFHYYLNELSMYFAELCLQVLLCSKKLFSSRRQGIAVIVTFLITVVAVKYIITRQRRDTTSPPMSFIEIQRLIENRLKEYYLEEKGMGCDIPKLDPFSAEAMKFDTDLPKITCDGTDWVTCHKSKCYVKRELLKNMRYVTCSYRDIVYVDDQRYFLSDYTTVRGGGKYILNNSDHVKISCSGRNLNRHNIVGDGTPAALYAMLTGIAEHEHLDARKKITEKVFVNHELFMFHQLKEYGYRTAYFEDMPDVGTFQYRFNGFRHQPADHYLRAFLLENGNHYFIKQNGTNFYNHFHDKFCVGDTPQYQLFLNLTNEFLQLKGKKFCFTFIADISHNDFNQIATADEAVLWFLETLAARNVFKDTLVIVMGDHGSRLSKIRETYQGKLEERLPLMAIVLPEKLKQLRPKAFEALTQNIDVLTTPFDIHSTLLDILDLKQKTNKYKVPGTDLTRGMTLLEPIPKNRTCAEAGIVQHWCSCTKWSNVAEVTNMYKRVANVLADYIDSISEEQRAKCARRKLTIIHHVLKLNVNKQLLTFGYSKEEDAFLGNPRLAAPRAPKEYYQSKITMSPGSGVFEGTLTYFTQTDSFFISQKDISRISRYGTEPDCVSATHPHLNPFCFCTKNQRRKEIDFNYV